MMKIYTNISDAVKVHDGPDAARIEGHTKSTFVSMLLKYHSDWSNLSSKMKERCDYLSEKILEFDWDVLTVQEVIDLKDLSLNEIISKCEEVIALNIPMTRDIETCADLFIKLN